MCSSKHLLTEMDLWNSVTPQQKAATLIILFCPRGSEECHVVITTRALELRSFPGQAALPGGRAELGETPIRTALREAQEEIGFDPNVMGPSHTLELRPQLSKNFLLVQPCVIVIERPCELAELAPRLSSDEVSAAFAVPLSRFLSRKWLASLEEKKFPRPGEFMYFYCFQREIYTSAIASTGSPAPIHGLTARLLVDAAQVILNRVPDFPVMPLDSGEVVCRHFFSSRKL